MSYNPIDALQQWAIAGGGDGGRTWSIRPLISEGLIEVSLSWRGSRNEPFYDAIVTMCGDTIHLRLERAEQEIDDAVKNAIQAFERNNKPRIDKGCK